MHSAAHWQLGGGSGVTNTLPLGEIMLTTVVTATISEGVPTNRAEWHTFIPLIFGWLEINFSSPYHQFYVSCSPTREWPSGSYGTMSNSYQNYIKHYETTDFENVECLNDFKRLAALRHVQKHHQQKNIAVPATECTQWKSYNESTDLGGEKNCADVCILWRTSLLTHDGTRPWLN